MSLSSEVQDRWGAQLLINASNPQNTVAITLDATRFANAVADTESDFPVEIGTDFDIDDADMKNIACDGVYAKLLMKNGHLGGKEFHDSYIKRLRALKLTKGRDRIKASSDSNMTATTEPYGTRPAFDRSQFAGRYVPGQPSTGGPSQNPIGID